MLYPVNIKPCPVNGGFVKWSDYSTCNVEIVTLLPLNMEVKTMMMIDNETDLARIFNFQVPRKCFSFVITYMSCLVITLNNLKIIVTLIKLE